MSAAFVDQTVGPNASLIVQTGGPVNVPVLVGSAQLFASGVASGFAIFHHVLTLQETVVPLETRNASSYLVAFDNTNSVVLGVALANSSAQAASIPVVIRDDTGATIFSGSTPVIQGNGHTAFVLSDQFPATANKRGTIEFDTPTNGQINVLAMRFTPPNNALTTIPVLANVGTSGGSIAHIAIANGWKTTFVMVNTGTSTAQVHLKFFADDGTPLSLNLSFPQTGNSGTASFVDRSLAPGATLIVESTGLLGDPLQLGSAQFNTDGHASGFVILRYQPNGQEAGVPLESRQANAYVLAFDNTSGTATGVAISNVSAQAMNVPVTVRDDAGNIIATDTINLAANGHYAFTLVFDRYPGTANIRGTIEFDSANGQIAVMALRIPIGHTFTSLPALAK
jgi:hypothetical protein